MFIHIRLAKWILNVYVHNANGIFSYLCLNLVLGHPVFPTVAKATLNFTSLLKCLVAVYEGGSKSSRPDTEMAQIWSNDYDIFSMACYEVSDTFVSIESVLTFCRFITPYHWGNWRALFRLNESSIQRLFYFPEAEVMACRTKIFSTSNYKIKALRSWLKSLMVWVY